MFVLYILVCVCIGVEMDSLVHRCMYVWMAQCMNGWMDVLMGIYIIICNCTYITVCNYTNDDNVNFYGAVTL